MELKITISGLKPKNADTGFEMTATDEVHEDISEKLAEAVGEVLNTARKTSQNLASLVWDQDVFNIIIESKSDQKGREHSRKHQVDVIKPQ